MNNCKTNSFMSDMVLDMEGLKKVNKQLEDRLKTQSIFLDNVAEVFSIYDETMSLQYISPNVTKMLGFTAKEMMGGMNLERLSWKGEKTARDMFNRLLRIPERSITIQHSFMKKNGNKVILETTGKNLLYDPAIRGILFSTIDITAQKRAEREERLKYKMRSLSENSQDFIIRLSVNEIIYYANPVAISYTSDDSKQIINKTILSTSLPEAIKNYLKKIINSVTINPIKTSDEIIINTEMNDSNIQRIIHFTAIPEFYEDELETVLVIGHDITELKRISIELQSINKDLIAQEDKLSKKNRDLMRNLQQKVEEQSQILKLFIKYVPEPVVKKSLQNNQETIFKGELTNVTVLFSDIRGFTSLCEELDPNAVVTFLNDYYRIMSDTIKQYKGYINQYVGDEIFAAFGAPEPHQDNERNAVFCAIKMMENLKILNEKYKDTIKRDVIMGIGINCGEVVTGNLGSEEKIEYSMTGDVVNTGKRIETLSKDHPNSILISENIYKMTKDAVQVKKWEPVFVKGKKEPIIVYEILGMK